MAAGRYAAASVAAIGFALFTGWLTSGFALGAQSGLVGRTTVASLSESAHARLSDNPDAAGIAAGRADAVAAYRRSPVASGALGMVALADRLSGKTAQSDRTLAIAENISRRSPWLGMLSVVSAAERGDIPAMVLASDVAMRTDRSAREALQPGLFTEAANPVFAQALAARIATNPPWRLRFLEAAGKDTAYAGAAASLFEALHRSSAPPNEAELINYFITGGLAGDIGQLRQQWLRWDRKVDAKAAQLPVYDGGFAGLGGVPPFNWRLSDTPDASAALESDADGQYLAGRSSAGASAVIASQLLILTPGKYRLSFTAWSNDGLDRADFTATILCGKGGGHASKPIAANGTHSSYTLDMTVPADCPAQWLQFTTTTGMEQSAQSFALDDVKLVPLH